MGGFRDVLAFLAVLLSRWSHRGRVLVLVLHGRPRAQRLCVLGREEVLFENVAVQHCLARDFPQMSSLGEVVVARFRHGLQLPFSIAVFQPEVVDHLQSPFSCGTAFLT